MIIKTKGLHLYCTTCSQICTNKKTREGEVKACKKDKRKSANNCEGKKKYQSRIWNPYTMRTDKIKTWDEKNPLKVVELHNEFKAALKASKFDYKEKVKPRPLKLVDCAVWYLDWLQDIDVPEHEKQRLSEKHIKRCTLQLKAFVDLISRNISVYKISSHHVGLFHEYLINERGFKPETYNKYMTTVKAMFHFLNKQHDYNIKNPFQNVKKKHVVTDVKIITEEEFEKLLKVIAPENGRKIINGKPTGKNYYHSWLKTAFKLARLTGARNNELSILRWEHVKDNYIHVPNRKNSSKFKTDEYYIRPITQDLAEVLAECKGEKYLIAPHIKSRSSIDTNYLTNCFRHFWDMAGLREGISFSHFRKTYETRINILLGEKANLLGSHKSMSVKIKHYIGKEEIQKELLNVRLF